MKEHNSNMSHGLLLISILLVMCAPAAAQHSGDLGGNWNNPAGGTITNIIVDRYARRSEKKPAAKHSNATPTTASRTSVARGAVSAGDAPVRFRSTGTQLKTREIANLISPGDAQVFTLLTTLLQEFDKEARRLGKPNDLSLALSFFFATNATVYHDAGVPPDPQMLELRDTIAAALVEGNALSGVTDRQKQEMYEALVLYTGLALATYEEGKQGNAESLKIARQLAGANLLAVTGISPDKINFTDQGLSIDNGSSRADASASVAADSSANPTPNTQNNDPFPDRPGYAPQKPLSGTLNETITMADLVGTWDHGAGSVKTYINSSTGDYAGTSTSFYGEQYIIKSDGTFAFKFTGRANNRTVRESDSGNVILSGSFITFKFKGRMTQKYQFIAFMNQANGAAILSLVNVHDTFQGYDAAGLSLECGHGEGFIHCVGGEEWARLGAKPMK